MHIDELLLQVKQQITNTEHKAIIKIDSSWAQGRTIFGGISTALVYQAIWQTVSHDRVLRSLNTNFVGPISPNVGLHIEVEILREGKNVTQVMAKAVQNDRVCIVSQASFGVAKKSKIRVENLELHNMEMPKKAKFLPQIPKLVPKFLQHLDISIAAGKIPFSGAKDSYMHGWMRFKQAPEKITDAHLIALIDAWPPAVLQMLKWPAPASSMSWNVEFIHPHISLKPTDWFAYQVKTRQAADGYGHTEANIWDSAGELVAISRQTVAIFD
ncbi:acyl-CoA thioesterase [Colwelliaceae bacterium BS250]